jgi:DNA-binding response OmpR family regulator
MRILIIEDEDAIARVLERGLMRANFTVDVAFDGDAGLRLATENTYALIILDLMLPGTDGWSVCRMLRARKDRTPILMLTARDAVSDRVRGLDMGADDYLSKPFAFEELLARVRAQVRRDNVHRTCLIKVSDLEIDTDSQTVRRAGKDIALTPREYALLEALARNEGRPLTRETILERVWNDEGRIGSNSVDVYINLLRRKVDSGFEKKLIHTVFGVGYILRDDDAMKAEAA